MKIADVIKLFRKIFSGTYDYQEAMTRVKLTDDDIDRLREKLKESEFVPKFLVDPQVHLSETLPWSLLTNSLQLLVFLNYANGDIDKAAERLSNYYELKQTTPEFFENRDIESAAVQASLKTVLTISLPITPNNYNVILTRFINRDPKAYDFDEATKAYIMKVEEHTYRFGPRSGTIFITDLEGVSFGHLFRPSLSSIRKGMRLLQEASPMDVKEIHIMNSVPFLNAIIALIRPFIRTEMMNKIQFHAKSMDCEKFFAEHIPKSHLPSDYGGDLGSIDEINQQQLKAFADMRDYFLMEEKQVMRGYDHLADEYDERRRTNSFDEPLPCELEEL